MVSSSHEAMHRIFQEDPGIFSRTLHQLGISFADPVEVSVLSPDLTEVRPLERRLDTLLRIDTADGSSYLLAVEAQGRKDLDKPGSWVYYVGYLFAKYKMPPILLVVCQDEATARWASKPIHLGLPQWRTLTLQPLVLGPHNVPVVTDPSAAAEDIPVAVFSAITHGKQPQADIILKALYAALEAADSETAFLFAEITQLGLNGTPAAQIWRNLVTLAPSYFRSEIAEYFRDEGRAEVAEAAAEAAAVAAETAAAAAAEAAAAAAAEGIVRGEVSGRVEAVMQVLEIRKIGTTDAARGRIAACTDLDTLSQWLRRAITATHADDLFVEN